ncbi:uncharacterized protein HRG_04592 [Hirsutella rhossiliensis]|uniref:Uncharacterized protein n=1 Tax=Hirsutella rhossiliensis TaxID=111463 RepID=A0A9P8MZM5_9HYPO|nr:uncharacterized protein HRG_04592 [Hirsutella rhossiliensis]KAH0964164.1 hypothetical protein HRG_04592 [Hirsutella rhossiliensis]
MRLVPPEVLHMIYRARPIITKVLHQRSVIRLTIDSRGIKKVENLPERPRFQRWRTNGLVFVILDHTCLEGVMAHFKFGLLRLELPKGCHGLQTWDTPTPPDLGQCVFYPAAITSSTQFRTINLSETTGITFFFSYGEIYAIHAHTWEAPCAHSTYRRLSRRRQQSIIWVYVPISQKDSISALGARMSPSDGSPFSSTCLLVSLVRRKTSHAIKD